MMSDNVGQHAQLDWVDEMPLDLVKEVIEWMEAQAPIWDEIKGDAMQDRATVRSPPGHHNPASNQHCQSGHLHANPLPLYQLHELTEDYLSDAAIEFQTTLEAVGDSSHWDEGFEVYPGIFTDDLTVHLQDATPQWLPQPSTLSHRDGNSGTDELPTGEYFAEQKKSTVENNKTTLEEVSLPGVHNRTAFASDRRRGTAQSDRDLLCPYEGCTQERAFRRRYELNRHFRVKHNVGKPFWCTCVGCFKGQKAPAFARSDKLTAHVRTVHLRDHGANYLCPDSQCDVPPMELGLLGVHIKKRHQRWTELEHLRALVNAADPARVPCPLWRCSKTPLLRNLIPHLMEHDKRDLEDGEPEVLACNYSLVRGKFLDSGHEESGDEASSTHSHAIIGIQILCPICKFPCSDHASFEDHFDTIHAIAAPHRYHFESWRTYVHAEKLFSRWLPKPWLKGEMFWRNGGKVVQCPACDYVKEFKSFGYENCNHHLDMLVDPAEIEPYRRAILRLYPEFATHPVWDDMK